MMNRFGRAIVVALLPLLLASCASVADVSTRKAALSSSSFYASSPTTAIAIAPPPPPVVIDEPLTIPLVTLDGSPAEMGNEHGRALQEQIQFLQTSYLEKYLDRAGTTRKVMALAATSVFEKYMAPEHHAEVTAMAASAKIDPRMSMLAQCFLDLTVSVACSTVSLPASASPDGVARMGRNLDFPSLGVLENRSCVLIYRPSDGRYQFAAIGWPGMSGITSAMNEHGLVLCNMEVVRKPRLPTAMPYALMYRTVVERCRTVDEAIAMFEAKPRQTANNVMLMDAAGNRAVVELTPEAVVVRRAADENAALLSTNHQRGQDAHTAGRCWRYDLMRERTAKDFGAIGVKQIEEMLAAAMQKKFTLQSMVFEPSNRVVYLATGAQAADKKFYRIDLTKRFRPVARTPQSAHAD